jgi:hypothetical protein
MALPLGTTGSLGPGFPSARHVCLTVKLPYTLALCCWFPSSMREPLYTSVTLWEVTAPVKLPARHCPREGLLHRLVPQNTQGGISRAAPRELASTLLSLPPILHRISRSTMSSCSKGAQGLSVPSQVLGIFTETAISLDLSLRQWSGRYAIRAGRNLPDKEFRYLRTVIVTAAVYRGFGSELSPLPLTFRHRAGVRPYTSPYGFA